MNFECEMIEERDQHGDVIAVGAEWCEAREICEALSAKLGEGLYWLGCFAGVCGAALGVAMRSGGVLAGTTVLAGALILLAYGISQASWRIPGKRRSLLFYVDGDIVGSVRGKWKAKHGDIANIESEQLKRQKDEADLPYTHGVRIIMKNGRVMRIAQDLAPDDAVMVVTVLSQALMALRYDNGFPEDEWEIVY
jgi:hypothetical protein